MAVVLIGLGTHFCRAAVSRAAQSDLDVTDRDITAAVEAELRSDKGVSLRGVDVSTTQGIVTLTGAVRTLLAKSRTATMAESIRGVRGVIDRTTVTPESRPDQDIREAILRTLVQDPATDSCQISVSVTNAAATLTGNVSSNEDKALAGQIARGVKGLKAVLNNITVHYFVTRTDDQIDADVEARLAWDIWLNGDELKTIVKDGRVAVTGAVGSAVAKSRAFDDAWVNGVVSVDDTAVKVEARRRHDPRHQFKSVIRSGDEITHALRAALRFDPRVRHFAPVITVDDGDVILGGSVDNLKAKTVAEQDADNIAGVRRVDNIVKVRPKGTFVDVEVEKQLKQALSWDASLESSTIAVAVRNGIAYLSGAVDSRLEKTEAEDVASRTKGVVAIRDHVRVH